MAETPPTPPRPTGPLPAGIFWEHQGQHMAVHALHEQWTLRLAPEPPQALQTQLAKALGAFPAKVNHWLSGAGCTIFCTAPDSWLIRSESQEQMAERIQALGPHLGKHHHALLETSDTMCAMTLEGAMMVDVLAHGCPLDLRAPSMAPGRCAGSHFLKAPVLIGCMDTNTYHVQVRSSLASYVQAHLCQAACDWL